MNIAVAKKRNDRLEKLLNFFAPGTVLRASEIKGNWGQNLSRDLHLLAKKNLLTNLAPGLYLRPKKLGEFAVPADHKDLIEKFLKTNNFLVRNLSDFNSLHLGTTQMHNKTYVYNQKRRGKFNFNNRDYYFVIRNFPENLTLGFMLVDMLNNLEELGEQRDFILARVNLAMEQGRFKKNDVLESARIFGKYWVKRFFENYFD